MKLLVLGSKDIKASPSLLTGAILSHEIGQPSEIACTLGKTELNSALGQFVRLNNELYTGNGLYMESNMQIQLTRVLGDYSDLVSCDAALLVWDGIDLELMETRETLIGLDKLVYEVILK